MTSLSRARIPRVRAIRSAARTSTQFSQALGGLHYPLAIDRGGTLQHRFQADALSTVVILDAGGHVVWRSVDPTGADGLLRSAKGDRQHSSGWARGRVVEAAPE